MGRLVLKDVPIEANGVLLTTQARSVDVDTSSAELPATAFGGNGWEQTEAGLKSGTIAVEFFQSFDAGSVHDTLWPLHVNDTEFTLKIGPPKGGAVASDNPLFEGPVKLFAYKYLSGAVGEIAMNPVTFKLTGEPTVDVSGT